MLLFGHELDALFWAMFFSYGFGYCCGSIFTLLFIFWWANREPEHKEEDE